MPVAIDKNLFVYLTKRAGYDMEDVAEWWNCPRSGVTRRLNDEIKLRRDEMEIWMRNVGVADAGPVFFPAIVAGKQLAGIPAAGEPDGC